MKKIFLLALLALVSVSAFARKSYLKVNEDNHTIYGNVPPGIPNVRYDSNSNGVYAAWYGEAFNEVFILDFLVNNYGYEIVSTSFNYDGDGVYLLSKDIPSGEIETSGDVNKDGKVNVSDISTLVNIILGIVRDNPSLLEQHK